MAGCSSGWTKGGDLDLLSQTPGAQKAKGSAWKSCGNGKYIDRVIPEQTWAGNMLLLHHSSLRTWKFGENLSVFVFPLRYMNAFLHTCTCVSWAWLQESPRKKALESFKSTIEGEKKN